MIVWVVMALDAIALGVLCMKTLYLKCFEGVSWDMLVCSFFSTTFSLGYLFPLHVESVYPVFCMVLHGAILYKAWQFRKLGVVESVVTPMFLTWPPLSIVSLFVAFVASDNSIYSPAEFNYLASLYLEAAGMAVQVYQFTLSDKWDACTSLFFSLSICSRIILAMRHVYFWSYSDEVFLSILAPTMFQAVYGLDFLVLWIAGLMAQRRAALLSTNV